MWLEVQCFCPVCVYRCVHQETLLTQYLHKYCTDFYQTYTGDGDESIKLWGQRVKVQGH